MLADMTGLEENRGVARFTPFRVRRLVMSATIAVALMIFAVAMMTSVSPAKAAGKQCAHAHDARTLAQKRAAVYCIINAERAVEGIRPYIPDWRSELAAQRHSVDMAKRRYFSHNAPHPAPYGSGPEERMISAGWPEEIYDTSVVGWPDEEPPDKYTYKVKAVEELIATATGSPWDAVATWLGSKTGHCDGILNPNGDLIGVGFQGSYWTLDYLVEWNVFRTGIEVPWNQRPNCPRKPRTNHPPTLRVVKAVRRGKQLTVRLKTNVTGKVKVIVRQPWRTSTPDRYWPVKKLTIRVSGRPMSFRVRLNRAMKGAIDVPRFTYVMFD